MSDTPLSAWQAKGPYAVVDADGESIAFIAGPNKPARQALVAAAPDLLAALIALLPLAEARDEEYGGGDPRIAQAVAAIARAKGETP